MTGLRSSVHQLPGISDEQIVEERSAQNNTSAGLSCLPFVITRLVGLLLGVMCSIAFPTSTLAGGMPTEYQVKAAFIYNFARFIDWPRDSASALQIAVLGENPFGSVLNQLAEAKTINGRRIIFNKVRTAEQARGSHIVFVSNSKAQHLGAELKALSEWPVVTVSDLPNFLEAGGMIGLVMENETVQFEVNLAAAERAGIQISSKLLRLARNIRQLGEK